MVSRSTGSWTLAADVSGHYLWFPDGHLEGLTAHHLNQDRQL